MNSGINSFQFMLFLVIHYMEVLWKRWILRMVLGGSLKTVPKLSLYTKFAHQEIMWNYCTVTGKEYAFHKISIPRSLVKFRYFAQWVFSLWLKILVSFYRSLFLKRTHSFAFQEIKNVIFTADLFIFTKAKFFKMVWKFWTIVADALI